MYEAGGPVAPMARQWQTCHRSPTEPKASFKGTCRIVGFLNAPRFAKVVGTKDFVDITGPDAISLKVSYSTPGYTGFATGILSCAMELISNCEHEGVTTE